jgi:hypothetical protein
VNPPTTPVPAQRRIFKPLEFYFSLHLVTNCARWCLQTNWFAATIPRRSTHNVFSCSSILFHPLAPQTTNGNCARSTQMSSHAHRSFSIHVHHKTTNYNCARSTQMSSHAHRSFSMHTFPSIYTARQQTVIAGARKLSPPALRYFSVRSRDNDL